MLPELWGREFKRISLSQKHESPGYRPGLYGRESLERRPRSILRITLAATKSSGFHSCRVTTEGDGVEP